VYYWSSTGTFASGRVMSGLVYFRWNERRQTKTQITVTQEKVIEIEIN